MVPPLRELAWFAVVGILLLLVAYDRPCAKCGRWFGHRLVCPRRAL